MTSRPKPHRWTRRCPAGQTSPDVDVRLAGLAIPELGAEPTLRPAAVLDDVKHSWVGSDAAQRRNLGRKRALALREYAPGLELLGRLARGELLFAAG